MATRKRALGRGLSELLGGGQPGGTEGAYDERYPLDQLEPNPDQPREIFDEEALNQLAVSIKTLGVLQPLLVRREGGRTIIIAGERRYRAAKIAGLAEVPVRFLDVDDRSSQEMALVENLQRENLSPLELAVALKDLMERWNLTQEELAGRLGWSRSALANKTRLLTLPLPVREALEDGVITEGHARALLGLDDEELILQVYRECRQLGWSVRQTEGRVVRLNNSPQDFRPEKPRAWRSAAALRLAKGLGVKVQLRALGGLNTLTLSGLTKEQVKLVCEAVNSRLAEQE